MNEPTKTYFSFEERLRAELNPAQAEAALHVDGPLLVLAGAGSGKTRVITYRLAYLIHERNLAPWNILAVTFTNKAAGEMKERAARLINGNPRGWWIGTFHSICSRILRTDGKAAGIDPHFTIYDRADQLAAVKRAMKACDISTQELKPNAALNDISKAKSRFEWPADYAANARDYREDMVKRIYKKYAEILRSNNALDFDDLLMETVRLFKESEEVRTSYQNRFQQIMVDEYQDTNQPQYLLLKELARNHQRICVVGDDDQSIYRWRGADIRNILEFEREYPEAKVVRLEQNYRSSKTIISAASEMISGNEGRLGKSLWTQQDEGDAIGVIRLPDDISEAFWVADEIQRLHNQENVPFKHFAVFYRTNAQSRTFEEECIKRGVPYNIVAGTAFYDRKEIKDALAYARLLINPSDAVSFERVVNIPKRKLGAVTVAKLNDYAARSNQPVLLAAWYAADDSSSGLSPAAKKAFREFTSVFRACREKSDNISLAELLDDLYKRSGYIQYWKDESDPQADARIENIEELISAAAAFETDMKHATTAPINTLMMLEGFLENASLVSDQDSVTTDTDQIQFMTLHSAKGLEFPYVFMVGMEEELFPHSRTLDDNKEVEEERRLCYVGITRAMKKLYLTYVESRRIHGQSNWARPSRFIEEIPSKYREELTWRGVDSGAPAPISVLKSFNQQVNQYDPEEIFLPGDMVNHRSFGFGVVLSVEGEGGKSRITVDFQLVGQKTVVQEYARLQKV
ncbi:UvrD-helicase domain-containing protein [bacterium]|nr:UvrD-helicase domain-containing protein [bacterium]